MPKWLPYALVAAVCAVVLIVVLIVVLFGALSGGGGTVASRSEGASSNAANSAASATSGSVAYLAVRDGKVAIYTNSSAEPYKVTKVEAADLPDEYAEEVDDRVGFSSVEEAEERVKEYREAIKAAQEEAEREAAEKAGAEEKAAAQAQKDYIIPNSGTSYLSRSDVSSLSDDELSRAQNEIWARHGRRFKNNWLQSYFDSKSWYSGTIAPDDFLARYKPTDVENKNAELIQGILNERGYDVNRAHPN